MSSPAPKPKIGRPPKVPRDERRAQELLEALRETDAAIRSHLERRRELALSARDQGLTYETIGEAAGVTAITVHRWERAVAAEFEGDV